MPRPQFIPVDPHSLAEWDGRSDRSRKEITEADYSGQSIYSYGPFRQPDNHPVIVNGSLTPTSWLEALMQSTPGCEALGSSEELLELALAIEYEMQALLTDRERFVVEAIVFEGLSLRDVAARWGNAWGKTQVARIRDKAYAKLGASERLRELAAIPATIEG